MAQTSSAFSGIPNAQYTRLYLDFWVASQSIANNQTTFGYKLVIGGVDGGAGSTYGGAYTFSNAWSASASGLTWSWSTSSHKTIREGTFVVTHNADGTLSNRTLTASASFVTYGGTATASTSVTISVPTIPRSSTLSLSTTSQNIGSDIGWEINESYDYTHKIKYIFGNTSGWILGSSVGASTTETGAWTLPSSLANQIPNATSGSGYLRLYTYHGSTLLGFNDYIFTAKVPNTTTWQPSVPSVTITDAGSRPSGITSYVQGKARAKVVSSSSAQGGASIISYRVIVSGIGTYYGSNITSGFLTKSGTVTITVRATDSRGYYREKSNTVTVVAYSPPKLTTYTASRSPNGQGTNLAASINFSISSVGSKNTKQYRIRYRKTGGAWTTLVNSTAYYSRNTTHSATGVLDANTSYEVEFYLGDSYTSVTQIRNIGTAFQLLDFNASGRGMAVGKVSESDSFEVALPIEATPNVSIRFQQPVLSGGWSRGVYFHKSNDETFGVMGWYGDQFGPQFLYIGPNYGSNYSIRLHPGSGPTVGENGTIWHSGNSNVITDSGSNTNGRYIKFSDGTMICTKSDISVVGTGGSYAQTTWTFPAGFVDVPNISLTPTRRTVDGSGHATVSYTVHAAAANSSAISTLRFITQGTIDTATELFADAMAIGRWK